MDRSLVPRYLPSIDTVMYAFVAEPAAEGVPAPLARELTFAALCDDLCRLAGEEPPAVVGALRDAPVCC